MLFRTDLALETRESISEEISGLKQETSKTGDIEITRIRIETKKASQHLGKPIGEYVTIQMPPLSSDMKNSQEKINLIAKEIRHFLPAKGLVLVIGLGNSDITPDAFGPKVAHTVLATRHINKGLSESLGITTLRPVAVLAPGVLGQTGIESVEIMASLIEKLAPCVIIAIDALASRKASRLGCTLQLSNTGISPGSGVGNARPLIDKQTMGGVPVISIGVPTVVDAITLATDLLEISDEDKIEKIKEAVEPGGQNMIVTPREIDLLIENASKLTGMAINCALHPDFDIQDFLAATS